MTPQKQVSLDRPWLMPEVIEWLDCILYPRMTVLETGSGGSTVFFAQRVRHVITYEHNPDWCAKVDYQLTLRNLTARVHMHLSPGYPEHGLAITEQLDLVLIDGRGRVKSALNAWPWVKPGGWLILDDGWRPRYADARIWLDEECAATVEFRGTPHADELSTIAWRKRR